MTVEPMPYIVWTTEQIEGLAREVAGILASNAMMRDLTPLRLLRREAIIDMFGTVDGLAICHTLENGELYEQVQNHLHGRPVHAVTLDVHLVCPDVNPFE